MSDSPFATSILLTGGAGFLGRGILRYIERNKIKASVTIYSRDEAKHSLARQRYPWVRTMLGDVTDTDRLTSAMYGHEVVIHAAAVKHIPEAERDAAEAVRVNVDGSRAVANAARRAGVREVVGISTDKVCSPRNTYGASKMLMERLFQEAGRYGQTRFSCVRYGNVVSSTGSVIPMFLDQIERDGGVTITALEMTRFWLSIDDAVELIEFALGDQRKASVYTLLCKSMRIVEAAQAAWELAGKTGKVSFRIIGTRPGEKLHETLIDTYEAPHALRMGKYVIIPSALELRGTGSSDVMPYDSSHPLEWLTGKQMLGLIEDARRV